MGKCRILLSFAALLFCAVQLGAQESDDDKGAVWRRNVKFNSIGYELQTISNGAESFKNMYGLSMSNGRTYYLHKKPIAGLMKFGIDWTSMNISASRFADEAQLWTAVDQEDGGLLNVDLGLGTNVFKVDVGMGVGPSFTVNPVDFLKTGVYFHVTPTYSFLLQEVGVMGQYFTYFSTGLNVSYRLIGIGVEYRWCGDAQYKALFSPEALAEKMAGEGLVNAPEIICPTLSASSWRFTVSYRFGRGR